MISHPFASTLTAGPLLLASAFGTNGTLLIAAGDGASNSEVDPGGLYPNCFGTGKLDSSQDIGAFRSQWIGSLSGKILRVDPATGLGLASNPFFTGDPASVESRAWAYGLRNPYRFGVRNNGSSDPADGNPGTLRCVRMHAARGRLHRVTPHGASEVSSAEREEWCEGTELNRRHRDFQSLALPTELPSHRNVNRWGITS